MKLTLCLFADLTKALKQTKIVSCTVTPGPVQWKNSGKKMLRGSEELGELEAFLMKKVRTTESFAPVSRTLHRRASMRYCFSKSRFARNSGSVVVLRSQMELEFTHVVVLVVFKYYILFVVECTESEPRRDENQ